MNFKELTTKRRSVRQFRERKVERELIDNILEMTLMAPSAKNCRSTRIAIVEDREVLEKLSKLRSSGSAFLSDAPLAFVVMGDDSLTDLWNINSAISATVLQYAAESLGLCSCWVHVDGRLHDNDSPGKGTAEEYLNSIIPKTKQFKTLCIVAVGYPVSGGKPHEITKEALNAFCLRED